MLVSKQVLLTGIAAVALATPALAEDRSTMKQKEQYLYQQQSEQNLGGGSANEGAAIGATKPNSGPGVQGPADTRTGPSTKSPDGSADAGAAAGSGADANSGSANSGASSGEAGNSTQPSQDSSGVQGFPDTRTGPSTKSPDDPNSNANQ